MDYNHTEMKTEKRQYETPQVGVFETTSPIIAASTVTLGATFEDEDELQLEDGTWGGLDETLGGI